MKTRIKIQFSNGTQAEIVLEDEAERRLLEGDFLTIKTQHPNFGRLAAVDMQPRGTVIHASRANIKQFAGGQQ